MKIMKREQTKNRKKSGKKTKKNLKGTTMRVKS